MASSSADCVLGGVRLISSASSMLAKIGPGTKVQVRRPVVGIFFDDVGAGDVGRHQVGRELDALEFQAQNLRQRADQQRLGGSGQAGDQAVAADEQRDHHLLDHFLLADDHLANLGDDVFAGPSGNARSGPASRAVSSGLHGESGHSSIWLFFHVSGCLADSVPATSFCAGLKPGAASSAESTSSRASSCCVGCHVSACASRSARRP